MNLFADAVEITLSERRTQRRLRHVRHALANATLTPRDCDDLCYDRYLDLLTAASEFVVFDANHIRIAYERRQRRVLLALMNTNPSLLAQCPEVLCNAILWWLMTY